MASPNCLRLLEHFIRAAASRTFCTAGRSRPMRIAMMAITTRRSISVNHGRRHRFVRLLGSLLITTPEEREEKWEIWAERPKHLPVFLYSLSGGFARQKMKNYSSPGVGPNVASRPTPRPDRLRHDGPDGASS